MKLRFEVNQGDEGIGVVTIEVNASELTPEQRRLLEDRLEGSEVVKLHYDAQAHKAQKTYYIASRGTRPPKTRPVLIQAEFPTFEALMAAVETNESDVTARNTIL